MSDAIERNVRAHDRIAPDYEREHGEIFNPVEQRRLRTRLAEAVALVQTGTGEPHALDFGCGSGNLTHHLLELGCRVTAADVSPAFLRLVQARWGVSGRCTTLRLTGRQGDLPSSKFDLVATYSVLHHIPDYLGAVGEMVQALRPGGVLLIDHEASPAAWRPDPVREAWHRDGPQRVPLTLEKLRAALTPAWLAYRLRRLHDPHATLEGDIHVWPDDHIEWASIEQVVRDEGADPLSAVDYLLYRRHYDPHVYERYRARCSDTRSFIARKREPTG